MQLLTTQEVASHLKLKSKSTISRWVTQGKFPVPVLNNKKTKRWSMSQIDQWLAEQNQPTTTQPESLD